MLPGPLSTTQANLVEHTQRPGEVPSGVEVTAEQAESALGRTMATELNADISEAVDGDTKKKKKLLRGIK